MLRANWKPLLFIFSDHVPIPGRQRENRENRENGHSDQRAEGDLQAGQLSVLLIPLFSLINYSTLGSHRNTVISHAVIACSRLRDSGGKSFSNKKCEKRAGVLISLLISSHYVYYPRAWHRLTRLWLQEPWQGLHYCNAQLCQKE